jgi:hypothetical protein
MSYLNQNYFNNFQVRSPILKNPINRSIPLQLVKVRPADASVGNVGSTGAQSSNGFFTVEDLSQAVLRINPSASGVSYFLPSADDLIELMGVQNNGLPTPSYSNCIQQGDILILPVINRSPSGANIFAGTGGTGSLPIDAASTNNSVTGELDQLVIEFTNVSSGSLGVTGSYVIYGAVPSS